MEWIQLCGSSIYSRSAAMNIANIAVWVELGYFQSRYIGKLTFFVVAKSK